ncbi:ATP-binding protein [Chitinophaga sp. Cy-1792]|uniref:ATP-binding protein n=1 Tax=Chitinophaga sp. Cy-1792 TaxID=2608339 RepID=UPI00141E3618|nr:ATP-binding protein [Chitinophaga sp. Cy-1792]NIG57465.1 cyclic nucleotide-binding domain-containing protein [Chitinophaga sp. Cy-1792]
MKTVTSSLLKSFEPLKDVPEEQLQWLIDNSIQHIYPAGDFFFRQDDPVSGTHFIIAGKARMYISQRQDAMEIAMVEPESITGYLPFSRMKIASANCEVLEDMQVMTLPMEKINELIHQHFELTQALVHVMTSRVRNFTSMQQQSEKMMALGKLSAGLAHELNNPAAAILRGARSLKDHLQLEPKTFKELMNMHVTTDQVDAVNNLLFEVIRQGPPPPMGMMERNDKVDEMQDWLDQYKITCAPEIAENMTDFGFTMQHLEQFRQQLNDGPLSPVFNWINNNLITEKMVTDIEEAATRMGKLVDSVKAFTHMDQGQDKSFTDIHSGIQNTLNLLDYKLRKTNVTVIRNFDTSLPPVKAFVGELNQVWTNIIDNAIDAMAAHEKGTLEIATVKDGKCLAVNITDDGPGIPDDIINKIYDPFFTTKAIGQGTGMGLDIVCQIIRHHRGHISVHSTPGRTTFHISLPIND